MNYLKRLFSVVALLSVAACGGGGGNSGTPVTGGGTGGNSTLTLEMSSLTVTTATPAAVKAKLVDSAGVPISGAIVSFTSGFGLSTFSAPTALTDGSGIATVNVAPNTTSTAGGDQVKASVAVGTQTVTASLGFQITATTLQPTLSIAISSSTVTAASPATVKAKVISPTGSPVVGVVVTFTTDITLGALSAPTALTNEAGIATVTLKPASPSLAGAAVVTATATVGSQTTSDSVGYQLTATNVTIASFVSDLTTISAYGQTALTVRLGGTTAGSQATVNISSSCVAKSLAVLTPVSVSTSTGVATFTYRDAGCGSFDTVDVLQASVVGVGATASLQLTLTAPAASSISFVSATPQSIFLKGSGFTENSNIVFQVQDANGAGVPGKSVTLEPTTLAGGLLLDGGSTAVTKQTDFEGKVVVRINSGTVPTPVRVKATLVGTSISTVSSTLAIAVGLPSQSNFSLSQGTLNIEGYNIDGTLNTYKIIASDRLGNPVPDGTAINFVTESGQVQAIRNTVTANGLSTAVAQYQSSEPRPVDGRVTVLAYALGEESFLDANGNNVYDVGEDFQDLGDIFIDRLFNGTYNKAEDQYISLSIAGTDPCNVATSALLQLDATQPSRTQGSDGTTINSCVKGWGRAYVRRAAQTVLSTSAARPVFGKTLPAGSVAIGGSCPAGVTLINSIAEGGYLPTDKPVTSTYYPVGSVLLGVGSAKVGLLFMFASDANPVAFNPVAAGTTVTAAATKGLTVTVQGGSPVASTLSPTGVAIGYAFDDTTTSGTITVTFTSPLGLATSFSQFISLGTIAGTPCP